MEGETEIIIVRHGLTEWNKEGVFRGRADIPLSETGRRQADLLGRHLASETIDRIYSSPLTRAKETAQVIANYTTKGGVSVSDRLIDISYGEWEGLSHQEVKERYPELYKKWMRSPDQVRFPNGESLSIVKRRAFSEILDILDKHKGGLVLVVAHRVVNKVLILTMLGLPLSAFWCIRQDTACFTRFTYTGEGSFALTLHNEACHMKPIQEIVDTGDF
jgi:probable phosphoglycerate mutase